ncbi:MAG: hypothetical protein JWQ34_2794 [Mucilaginibacter sp.]|uniref:hypothetical protein n=1 Tax=Mucilaginibacter sp. TaxID=1882438 RepID=UPI00260CC573|nr:hypothetical protein [Mucilaginibacter sp.]MDB5004569.1 hypothetical protein [Mucilaginibacter sp.]
MAYERKGIRVRTKVLKDSLFFESLIADIAAKFLNISNPNESNCFGNTSKSLSFNQKVFLLIDLGILDKTSRDKLVKFMEIRNQFMHNIHASSFEKCFSFLEGTENYLFKLYPINSNENKESKLALLYDKLKFDIIAIIRKLIEELQGKTEEKITQKANLILNGYYQFNIQAIADYYRVFTNNITEIVVNPELNAEIQRRIQTHIDAIAGLTLESFRKSLD